MINFIVAITALLFAGYLVFSPRLNGSSNWRATTTPLASIMGSGFLISAPLLAGVVGNYALYSMALLLLIAFAVGSVIRFNIQFFEPIENDKGLAQNIAFISRIVLAIAYFISVSYYLQLLAAFLLSSFDATSTNAAHWITSGIIVAICFIGIWKGLDKLSGIEKYIVSINLSMIAALLVALLIFNIDLWYAGNWHLAKLKATSEINLNDLRVLLGLLIVVQGFETSRFLGDVFPAKQRIQTMRNAQIIATIIYLSFIGLSTVLFRQGLGADVTAIIVMIKPVAFILPLLLAVTAIGSQFSAAVADSEGAAGLLEDVSKRRISMSFAYGVILFITLALTWATNVNAIIAYASRAFALFYFLQCCVAVITASKLNTDNQLRQWFYAVLAVFCLAVFLFGIPSG